MIGRAGSPHNTSDALHSMSRDLHMHLSSELKHHPLRRPYVYRKRGIELPVTAAKMIRLLSNPAKHAEKF